MTPTDYQRMAEACDNAALAEDECAVSYGYFHGGDPRNFDPDPECSTEAERAAHKAACEAWERGERPEIPVPHMATPDEARAEIAAGGVDSACIGPHGAIVHPTNFGLGTNTDPCPIAADLRAAADHFRALAKADVEGVAKLIERAVDVAFDDGNDAALFAEMRDALAALGRQRQRVDAHTADPAEFRAAEDAVLAIADRLATDDDEAGR